MRTIVLLLAAASALSARAQDADPVVRALSEATDGLRDPVRLLEKADWDRGLPAEGRRPRAWVLPIRAPAGALSDAAAIRSTLHAQLETALPGLALVPDEVQAELALEAEVLARPVADAPVAVVRVIDLAKSRILALGINGKPYRPLAPLVVALAKALPERTIGWPGPKPLDGRTLVRVRIETIADESGQELAPLLLPWIERALTRAGLDLALDAAAARRLGELEPVKALRATPRRGGDDPVAFLLEGALAREGEVLKGRLGLRRPKAEKAGLEVEAALR